MHRRHHYSLGSSKRKRHRGLYPLSLHAYRLRRQGKADRSGMASTRQGDGPHRKPNAPRRKHLENGLQSVPEPETLRINQTAQDPAKQFPRHYGRLETLEQRLNVIAAPQRRAGPHSRRRQGLGRGSAAMKKNNIWELILKVLVAAITAALTAITTTSCIGFGPF